LFLLRKKTDTEEMIIINFGGQNKIQTALFSLKIKKIFFKKNFFFLFSIWLHNSDFWGTTEEKRE